MTWEIFLGLAALAAFLAPILTVTARLTRTLTHLEEALTALKSECDSRCREAAAARRRLDERLQKLENRRSYR